MPIEVNLEGPIQTNKHDLNCKTIKHLIASESDLDSHILHAFKAPITI